MAAWAGLGVNFLKGHWEVGGMVYAVFYSSFSSNVITSLSIGSIKIDYHGLINPFKLHL